MTENSIGIIYENAMSIRNEQVGKCESAKILTNAINSLSNHPHDTPVVINGCEVVVNIGEALTHLHNRLSAIHSG